MHTSIYPSSYLGMAGIRESIASRPTHIGTAFNRSGILTLFLLLGSLRQANLHLKLPQQA